MKGLKKIAAGLLAAGMLTGVLAGCSGDPSWAMKTTDRTIPMGAYLYNLYAAYSAAEQQKTDSSVPLMEQQIDGKDAKTWIRDRAQLKTKQLLYWDDKLAEMGVTLNEEDQQDISDLSASQWASFKKMFDELGLGVAQSSFELAYGKAAVQANRVFEATYGKGGPEEVSDAEVTEYFEKTYTSYSYLFAPSYDPTTYQNLDEDTKAKLKQEFEDYAAKVKSGEMTMQEAADAYKKSSGQETDQLGAKVVNLATSTGLPDVLVADTLQEMAVGEARFQEISLGYVVLQKNDIKEKTAELLTNGDSRLSILWEIKGDVFNDLVDQETEAYAPEGLEVNQGPMSKYDPQMFVSESSSAPASSSASSEAAGSSEAAVSSGESSTASSAESAAASGASSDAA